MIDYLTMQRRQRGDQIGKSLALDGDVRVNPPGGKLSVTSLDGFKNAAMLLMGILQPAAAA